MLVTRVGGAEGCVRTPFNPFVKIAGLESMSGCYTLVEKGMAASHMVGVTGLNAAKLAWIYKLKSSQKKERST